MYVCLTELTVFPECILIEPGIYIVQFKDPMLP